MIGPAPVCQPGWRNHGGFSEPTVPEDVGWDPVPANPFSRDAFPPSYAAMPHPDLSIRIRPGNPNHHLFNNHGTWWIHYTVHQPDFTKSRIRQSARTGSLLEARRRRDQLLSELPRAGRRGGSEGSSELAGFSTREIVRVSGGSTA